MEKNSYYHCAHCRKDTAIEINCPCCGLPEELKGPQWLDMKKIHAYCNDIDEQLRKEFEDGDSRRD